MKRLICMSDIHGCHVELQGLLAKLDINLKNDQIWILGDAFDRAGPDCAQKVYQIIKDYGIKYIYGNHDGELKHKITQGKPIWKPWYKDWWNDFSDEARRWFLDSERYYALVPEFNVLLVHAGVNPKIPYWDTSGQTLCTTQCITKVGEVEVYSRLKRGGSNISEFWTQHMQKNDVHPCYRDIRIVYGHTCHWPKDEQSRIVRADLHGAVMYNVDWAAVHGGELAAVVFNADGSSYFECIKSQKNYYKESYGQD